jgi:hypothetical protein
MKGQVSANHSRKNFDFIYNLLAKHKLTFRIGCEAHFNLGPFCIPVFAGMAATIFFTTIMGKIKKGICVFIQ